MKLLLYLIFLFGCETYAFAKADTVIVHKDPRLELLAAKQAVANKRNSMLTSAGLYKGFRIQIASTSSRDRAFNDKAELLLRFPNEKSYVLFQSPYFKVRIGNFLKREDADEFRKQVLKYFPGGAYVVEDAIEYTPSNEDDQDE